MSGTFPLRALVVEDELLTARIVQRVVETAGFSCTVTAAAESAWDLCERDPPDVILCDLILPGADGLSLCERVRANESRRYTWFILVTGGGRIAELADAYARGADECYLKPFDPVLLRARLEALARVVRRLRALERASEP